MAPLDAESQFQFLISCIKHSNSGKVDFNEVRKECNIISKGAAAKRYERLMRAHGINGGKNKSGAKESAGVTKVPPKKKKKRKLAAVDENAGDVDEPVKMEVKGEVKYEDAIVKMEQSNSGISASVPETAMKQESDQAATTITAPAADDDGEVFVISATQKRQSRNNVPTCENENHHHHHHHHHHNSPNVNSTAPSIPGIQSFEFAANMGYPTQAMMTARPSGFTSGGGLPWYHHHDGSGYFWQGMAPAEQHKEVQHE